jgi:hypothetical protein
MSGMPRTVRTETYKRGFFGWTFKLLFIVFNLLMLAWLISYWAEIGEIGKMALTSDAARIGAAIGSTIGTGVLFFFWVAGAVILGLLTLFTHGKKVIVEETVE